MIVLDIETTGLEPNDCGICEIGAINLEGLNYFIQDCRIDEKDIIDKEALKINGRTRKELFDFLKQSQKELLQNYFDWAGKQSQKIYFGQNIVFDLKFIYAKSKKYGLLEKFHETHTYRGNDIHTLAQDKYFKIYGEYFLDENGQDTMNSYQILKFCGIQDIRKQNIKGKIIGGENHDALNDCRLEGEELYRIKFGKNLFPEFKDFPIPDYLKKIK